MNKICTTTEQSKKLIELGLDVNTADMYYPYLGSGEYGDTPRVGEGMEYSGKEDIPSWSLPALLKLLPKVKSINASDGAYCYDLMWDFANDNSLRYIATNRSHCLVDIYSDHDSEQRKDFVDTAFEMVSWYLKNKEKRQEEQK